MDDFLDYKSFEDEENYSLKASYENEKMTTSYSIAPSNSVELDQIPTIFEQHGPIEGISVLCSISASNDEIHDFFSSHFDLLQLILQTLSETTNVDQLHLIVHNIIQLAKLSPFIILSFIEVGTLRYIDEQIQAFPTSNQILNILELLKAFSAFSSAIAIRFMKHMSRQFIEFIRDSEKPIFFDFINFFQYCYDPKMLTQTATTLLFQYTEILLSSKHTSLELFEGLRHYINSTKDYSSFIKSNIIPILTQIIKSSFKIQNNQSVWRLIGTLYQKKILNINFDFGINVIFGSIHKGFNLKAQFWCLDVAIVERKIGDPIFLCRMFLSHFQDYFCRGSFDAVIEGSYCLLHLLLLLDESQYPLICDLDLNPIFLKFFTIENADILEKTVKFFERFLKFLEQKKKQNYILDSLRDYQEVISGLLDSSDPMIKIYGRHAKSFIIKLFPEIFSNH